MRCGRKMTYVWQIEGDLAPQASSMRMLSKSSLQAATYNGMSTLGTSDKYPSFDFSPPDPLIMLLGSQAHVANKVRCLARAKGRQKYNKGGAGNRGGAIPTTWLAGGSETWDSTNNFLSCCSLSRSPPLHQLRIYDVNRERELGWSGRLCCHQIWDVKVSPEVLDQEHIQLCAAAPTQPTPWMEN